MQSLRAKPAALALAAVAVPLPLHLVGSSHRLKDPGRTPLKHPGLSRRHRERSWYHAAKAVGLAASPTGTSDSSTTTARSQKSGAIKPKARAGAHLPMISAHSWHLALAVKPSDRRAHAAKDPGDTISDFKFTPGTLTVHVGDTVTWTNDGPSEHTATASNGSFNTGLLKTGQSASHTFSQAGTFAYICAIHPFMHGTIVVEAASTTPSHTSTSGSSGHTSTNGSSASNNGASSASNNGASSTSNSGSSSTSNTTNSNGSTLPATGLDLTASALLGLALVSTGVGLRRGVR